MVFKWVLIREGEKGEVTRGVARAQGLSMQANTRGFA